MKQIIQYSVLILLTGCVGFVGCKKEEFTTPFGVTSPPSPPSTPTDTLSGKEFLFEDLQWVHAGPGGVAEEEIWIAVENRPELFNNPSRQMEVSIKFDTSSAWINVPRWNWPVVPANPGYLYIIMYNSSFYVESYPLNFQLIGRKASLKIKFL